LVRDPAIPCRVRWYETPHGEVALQFVISEVQSDLLFDLDNELGLFAEAMGPPNFPSDDHREWINPSGSRDELITALRDLSIQLISTITKIYEDPEREYFVWKESREQDYVNTIWGVPLAAFGPIVATSSGLYCRVDVAEAIEFDKFIELWSSDIDELRSELALRFSAHTGLEDIAPYVPAATAFVQYVISAIREILWQTDIANDLSPDSVSKFCVDAREQGYNQEDKRIIWLIMERLSSDDLDNMARLQLSPTAVAEYFAMAKSPVVEDSSPPPGTGGYVYALINPAMPGWVKVGQTRRSPAERAKELSSATGVPTPFLVAYQARADNCSVAERAVHAKLGTRGFHIDRAREFFYAPLQEVIRAIHEVVGTPADTQAAERTFRF